MLDISLGFAAGVMLAASYWSLLAPALEMAGSLETYGKEGEWAFLPVAVGFFLGALFVYGADILLTRTGISSNPVDLLKKDDVEDIHQHLSTQNHNDSSPKGDVRRRNRGREESSEEGMVNVITEQTINTSVNSQHLDTAISAAHWRRILLLIVAITVHNIPEGLAVGVGFGAVGQTASATFASARNLALGIGIQNFPEGLSVSLPLKAAGFTTWRAIWYGQLSGLVEPFAGLAGAALVTQIVPILPYALAFAAGAMVFVVVDDIVPEAQTAGHGKAASWAVIAGFIVMMSLDVALG